MNTFLRTTQRAAAMVELMMALSVAAIIVLAGVRYYNSAMSAAQVERAVKGFGVLASAMQEFYAAENEADHNTMSITTQINNGYLPTSFSGT